MHGKAVADDVEWATEYLFGKNPEYTDGDILRLENILPNRGPWGENETIIELLVKFGLASSKSEARKLIKSGAITFNGKKITSEEFKTEARGVLRRGKKQVRGSGDVLYLIKKEVLNVRRYIRNRH